MIVPILSLLLSANSLFIESTCEGIYGSDDFQAIGTPHLGHIAIIITPRPTKNVKSLAIGVFRLLDSDGLMWDPYGNLLYCDGKLH
jgi:hypothetical protein